MASPAPPAVSSRADVPAALGAEGVEEAAEALAVALRIDCAQLRDAEAPDVPVSIYDDPSVKLDVADDLTVLVGFQKVIYTVGVQEDVEAGRPNGGERSAEAAGGAEPTTGTAHSDATPAAVPLCVIVDVGDIQLEEEEVISDVKWLDREFFCVGYSSGVIRIFNRLGKLFFEQ
ncbi:hypothetical protein BBJ28_00021173, partial [Nothophytophthora sp. Chile5]